MTDKRKTSGKKFKHGPLVLALASGMSITAAAERADVDRKTVYRRMKDPEFMQQVTEAREEMIDRAIGKIAHVAAESVTTLRSLLKSQNETARLGAAKAILDVVGRLHKQNELSARLAELEAQTAKRCGK